MIFNSGNKSDNNIILYFCYCIRKFYSLASGVCYDIYFALFIFTSRVKRRKLNFVFYADHFPFRIRNSALYLSSSLEEYSVHFFVLVVIDLLLLYGWMGYQLITYNIYGSTYVIVPFNRCSNVSFSTGAGVLQRYR